MFRCMMLLGFFVLAGCASQKQVKTAPNPISLSDEKNASPRGLEQLKSPAKIRQEAEVVGSIGKPYFAHVQILSETVRGSNCRDDQRHLDQVIEDFDARLNESSELVVNGVVDPRSVLNVELRAIGFDESRYQTSLVNNSTSDSVPYDLNFSVRPNNVVRLNYLGETADLRLDNTPVYSFSVKEERGACEVTHNVNLFAETAGRFPIAKE